MQCNPNNERILTLRHHHPSNRLEIKCAKFIIISNKEHTFRLCSNMFVEFRKEQLWMVNQRVQGMIKRTKKKAITSDTLKRLDIWKLDFLSEQKHTKLKCTEGPFLNENLSLEWPSCITAVWSCSFGPRQNYSDPQNPGNGTRKGEVLPPCVAWSQAPWWVLRLFVWKINESRRDLHLFVHGKAMTMTSFPRSAFSYAKCIKVEVREL